MYLNKQMSAILMCMIFAEKLTTEEAICEMWARRRGADFCEIEGGGIMPFDKTVLEARRCSTGGLYHRTSKSTPSQIETILIPY